MRSQRTRHSPRTASATHVVCDMATVLSIAYLLWRRMATPDISGSRTEPMPTVRAAHDLRAGDPVMLVDSRAELRSINREIERIDWSIRVFQGQRTLTQAAHINLLAATSVDNMLEYRHELMQMRDAISVPDDDYVRGREATEIIIDDPLLR